MGVFDEKDLLTEVTAEDDLKVVFGNALRLSYSENILKIAHDYHDKLNIFLCILITLCPYQK